MHCVILGAVLIAALATVSEATTPSGLLTRISSEQRFVLDQVSEQKSSIASAISSTRSNLNSQAEALKTKQRNSGKPCDSFVEVVESIQKSNINFLYAFRACEMSSELGKVSNVKNSLTLLVRTAENLVKLCSLYPSIDCQNRINDMDRNLDVIHNSVVADISKISSDSRRCIEGKSSETVKLLERDEETWKKCVDRN